MFWNAARACLSARVIEMMQGVIAKEALAVTSLQGGLMPPSPSSPPQRESRRSSSKGHTNSGSSGSSGISPKAFIDSTNETTNAAESLGATLRIPEGISSDLSSSEWRRRLQGIDRVRKLVADGREQLSELSLQSVVECLAPRLTDSNSKVNVFALEALQSIVAFTKVRSTSPSCPHRPQQRWWQQQQHSSMRSTMSVLVPPLGSCMASSHANVRRIASDVVDSLMLVESDVMRAELLQQVAFDLIPPHWVRSMLNVERCCRCVRWRRSATRG